MSDPLQKLRNLVTNCAYCGIELENSNKTFDHIIPRCAGGKTTIKNIVVSCWDCNNIRGRLDIKFFLKEYKKEDFFNKYLDSINLLVNQVQYSELVRKNIEKSKYKHKAKVIRRKREERTEQYTMPDGRVIMFTPTQARVLEAFLADKFPADHKKIAVELEISQTAFKRVLSDINNLTGALPLDKVSDNGVTFNPFFEGIERAESEKAEYINV